MRSIGTLVGTTFKFRPTWFKGLWHYDYISTVLYMPFCFYIIDRPTYRRGYLARDHNQGIFFSAPAHDHYDFGVSLSGRSLADDPLQSLLGLFSAVLQGIAPHGPTPPVTGKGSVARIGARAETVVLGLCRRNRRAFPRLGPHCPACLLF